LHLNDHLKYLSEENLPMIQSVRIDSSLMLKQKE